MNAVVLAEAYVNSFVFVCLLFACAFGAIGFCLWVREQFKADVDPPDLHTDWESNKWISDKNTLTGVWKR